MFQTLLRWLVRATLCTTAFAAQAQGASSPTAAPAPRADPLDAKASVPALSYRSSFARYRTFSDDKPLSWQQANDAVARIGGWRVYAREAQQPDDSPRPMSMPPGHGGHKSP
jgi:hypothetical protein